MFDQPAGMGAKLGMSFNLEWRDKDGNILKTVQCRGSVPLSETGLTIEQAKQLIKEQNHGNHSAERG